jgi:hypothetical protein
MHNSFRIFTRKLSKADPLLEQLPALSVHEVTDREITRVIDIWADGHTGLARSRDMLELGGSLLPEHPDPHPGPDIPFAELSSEQFERFWTNAVRRVEWELGVSIPD